MILEDRIEKFDSFVHYNSLPIKMEVLNITSMLPAPCQALVAVGGSLLIK